MPTTLRNVKLTRIDLVDAPANPSARVVLVKRDVCSDPTCTDSTHDHDSRTQKDAPGTGAVHVPVPTRRRSVMKDSTLLKRFVALLKSDNPIDPELIDDTDNLDELDAVQTEMADALDGLPADHKLRAVHKSFADMVADKKKKKKASKVEMRADGMSDEDVDKVNKMIAKRTDDIQKSLDAANVRVAEAESIAKSERATRELTEVKVELAKFDRLTLDIEKEAPLYKSVRESNKPAYDSMMATLTAANEVAKANGALETTIGSGVPSTGKSNAWAEIEAKAMAIVAKGDTKLTKAKAINLVMEDAANFDLVKRYQAEGGANDPAITS